jgi:hypothetical protein
MARKLQASRKKVMPMLKLLSSAKAQYRAAFKAMAFDPVGWRLYKSHSGVVLSNSFDGEVLVERVGLLSEREFLKKAEEVLEKRND